MDQIGKIAKLTPIWAFNWAETDFVTFHLKYNQQLAYSE